MQFNPVINTLQRICAARSATVERGQSTVEYALLLVGVAAIALLVVTWATGSDAIPRLFDAVFGNIVDNV